MKLRRARVIHHVPVPGGVGPMTVATFIENTLQACIEYHDPRHNMATFPSLGKHPHVELRDLLAFGRLERESGARRRKSPLPMGW